MLVMSCLRSLHQIEKGGQPGGESTATSTGQTVLQSSAVGGLRQRGP